MYNYTLSAYVRSDVGTIRTNNEDNYNLCGRFREDVSINNSEAFCNVSDREALFSVCDGMGGENCGEIASLIAVSNLRSAQKNEFRKISAEDVLILNEKVCESGRKEGNGRTGTTLSNLYIDNGHALACNVGDSRTYLLRDGILYRLSVDHDEATRLINMGVLTPEQAKDDNRRHQLTQFLGMHEDDIIPEPYCSDEIVIEDGDRFFICSDGISDVLSDEDIRRVLKEGLPVKDTVNRLIDMALECGSKDNCTALLVESSLTIKE